MLASRLLAALASVVTAVGWIACGGDNFTSDGAGGSSGTSSGGGSCAVAQDCPGEDLPCLRRACTSGGCSLESMPLGQPTTSQYPGDCKRVVCDGEGSETVTHVDDDPFVDGNACTEDRCDGGMASNPILQPPGGDCPDTGNGVAGKCDAAGQCVECLVQGDCGADLCQSGQCVPVTCQNEVQDGGETDLNCGGPECLPCGDGHTCQQGSDCMSKVCEGDQCQAPACGDGVQNGAETGKDCGGASGCPLCPPGEGCAAPGDCESLICVGGICQAADCDDGVANGSESDIDCGGSCDDCPNLSSCFDNGDCQSQFCVGGICVSTCANGQQDGAETDIDCGGGKCAPCSQGQTCACDTDCDTGTCCASTNAGPALENVCGTLDATLCVGIPCATRQ
jgi:hypothetical protein